MKTKDEIQKEALDIVSNHKKCGLALSMGIGKTFTGLKYILENITDDLKVLVTVPKLEIIQSWKDEAKKYNLEHLIDFIDFTTYLSLTKQKNDYDIIILDECHNLKYKHKNFLLFHKGKILGLTGTPPRISGSEKKEMVDLFCPIIFEYLTDNAVEDGMLNNYKIIVHYLELSSSNDLLIQTKTKSWYTCEQKNYDYWSERIDSESSQKQLQFLRIQRMTMMKSYTSKEKYAKELLKSISDKCLVFANTQEQADRLCEKSFHSKNPDSKDNLNLFKTGKITKLSCVMQLSEGVNIPNLKESIILHAYSNNRKLSQRLGRTLRLAVDETATIHVLCYKNTVDEEWVKNSLKEFDQTKITWIDTKSKIQQNIRKIL